MKGTRPTLIVLSTVIVLSFAAAIVGASSTDPAQRRRPAGAGQTATAPSGGSPVRTIQGGAPQADIDAALFVIQPFFDVGARLERPYAEARPLVEALSARFATDPRLKLHLARLDQRLGNNEASVTEMEQFATLSGRSPNALRRLAAFYRVRAMAGDEVKTLVELAAKLPASERAPVYRRAIAAANDGRPAGVNVDTLYEKLIDSDPGDGEALRAYVSLLLESGDSQRALRIVDMTSSANKTPAISERRVYLSEKSRIYDRTGQRANAVAVYDNVFDPLWPRVVASDYYALLSRYGLYRERRRALQQEIARGNAPLATVSRLFNFYAYEGNLPAAAKLLQSLESARGANWSAADLQLAAELYSQIGDLDQASRYLYTLYLQGGMVPGSPDRERILSRLFTALARAQASPSRLAPGGISMYADIARLDARPGALNGLLSLILAGNNASAEYAAEEARAGGYFNCALAHSIYSQFAKEYPSSPQLGQMTVDMLDALASLGADREVVTIGTAFLDRAGTSPEYDWVALGVADAYVRLKNRSGERTVLLRLLDRIAARQPANRPLLERSATRWIYRPDETPGDVSESNDDAPPVFVAPNGTVVPASVADRFLENPSYSYDDSDEWKVFDPTEGGSNNDRDYRESFDNYLGQTDETRVAATYSDVLERMVTSFETDKQQAAALAFFWAEVNKHPRDEGLHERFLTWLGSTSLINEQLKAYRLALDRYEQDTWVQRFARWYVRRGRGAEVRRLTEQVARTLDDESVSEFLEHFAGYGGTPTGDRLDWDKAVALQVTRIAHARFPNNTTFVQLMLNRLAETEAWPEWEKLSREYYFASKDIREEYLKRISQTGQLAAAYEQAQKSSGGGLDGGPSSAFAYAVFSADAARWQSRHAEAIAAYTRLTALYPGERAYAEPLADLLRSFGSHDPKLYLEAAKVYDGLSAIYPAESAYPTKAGEVLAEAGEMGEAAKRWRRIAAVAPGSPAARLETATVFWDYYQFNDAAAELLALRLATHDNTIYAFRLGAVYDSNHDIARAIPEYVRALGQNDSDKDQARERLAELSLRKGVVDQIAAAYDAERRASPDRWRLILGYADFLKWIDRTGEAVSVINREVGSSQNSEFVDEARDRLHSWNSPESEERALRRLVDLSHDEREKIRAELQLASFYDVQERTDDAVRVFETLVAENPTNEGVLDEATRFLWRVGRLDRSVSLSQEVIRKAEGPYKKKFVLALADRQINSGRLADAEATLAGYFNAMPLDLDVFRVLARVLGLEKREEALAALYSDGLKRIKEADLSEDDTVAQVAELRRGMIGSLTALGRFSDAVDQHIEIINRDPESEEVLDAAFEYAERHQLSPRLVGYYEKLAKDANKDYRWSLVLGRLSSLAGNPAGAVDAYRRAVSNEPQRLDIRSLLADALVKAGRNDDAVAELRRAWEIDGREPQWLVTVARIRAREGRYDDASKAIDEAIASRAKIAPSRVFQYAGLLAEWGLLDKSVEVYERGIEMARKTPQDSDLDQARFRDYLNVAIRVRRPADLFTRIEAMRTAFESLASAPNNYAAASARAAAEMIDSSEREDFGRLAGQYATGAERSTLDGAVRVANSATAVKDRRRTLLALSRAAGLADAEEAIQLQLVNEALATVESDKSAEFHAALTETVEMFDRRAQYVRAAQMLEGYRAKDVRQGDFEYDRQIAANYRLAGDTANEVTALERLYRSVSGDVRTNSGGYSVEVQRLFDLLLASGQADRTVALASVKNPYQFELINYLIERGDAALAQRAIEAAAVSPAWVTAQSAALGLYFRDGSPRIESAFRSVLRVQPIGDVVGKPFDAKTMLVGSDYFLVSRNYGLWLDLVAGRSDAARDFIVGRTEDRPRDGTAQSQLARYYLVRNNPTSALAHSDLAFELSPADRDVIATRGEILFALNRTDDAVAMWSRLVADETPDTENMRTYFAEMSGHGKLEPALTVLRDKISNLVYRSRGSETTELIGDLGDYGRQHPESWNSISDLFYGIAVGSADDMQLLKTVLDGDLVPEPRRGPFFRLLTDRLAVLAASLPADSDGSTGVTVGDDYIYPLEELNTWRRRTVDYLIVTGSLQEAGKLLDSIDREQASAPKVQDGDSPIDLSWISLARATVQLKSGKTDDAVATLNEYVFMQAEPGEARLPDMDRCASAVSVLRAGGAATQADALLDTAYRTLLDARVFSDSNFIGLADVLYRKGKGDEGDAVIRRLASRKTDDAGGLRTAAATASAAGRYALAIELRESVARLSRADSENALELGRLRIAAGDAVRGASALVDVAGDERASLGVRAEAVDTAAMAAKDAGVRAALASRLANAKSQPERILGALVAAAGGDVDGARRTLQPLSDGGDALASIELGRLERTAGRSAEASRAFEKAVAVATSPALDDSIAFGGSTSRDSLIVLYGATGRDAAAIALADIDRSNYVSEDEATAAARPFVFEPSVGDGSPLAGLPSIASLNAQGRLSQRLDALASLTESAYRLQRWDDAVSYARRRAEVLASGSPERAKADERLTQVETAKREAERKLSQSLKVGEAVATDAVSIRELTLD